MYYNGVDKMVVRGMHGLAQKQQEMVTCMYYNGVDKMAVHGMSGRVNMQQKKVT